jgi:hypothetical protein
LLGGYQVSEKRKNEKKALGSFEQGMVEIAGLVFGSVMEYKVKPTVAKLLSMAAARKVVRKAGTDAFARIASGDPDMDAAYADVNA